MSNAEGRIIAAGVAVGLFTFVLHDMINFATFVPGSATTLFAMLAVCVAEKSPVISMERAPKGHRLWGPIILPAGAIIAVLAIAAVPVWRAGHYQGMAIARAVDSPSGPLAADRMDKMFLTAVSADPLDPTPCVERARWWRALSADALLRDRAFRVATESLAQAVERDSVNVAHRRMLAKLYQEKARHTREEDDYLAAIASARQAVRLYPSDPEGYLLLGDCQLAAGEATGSDELTQQAIESLEQALAADNARPEWERIRGFLDRELDSIRGKIDRARRLLEQQP
jgi:tetratricopeptide (TPR) repeat protein